MSLDGGPAVHDRIRGRAGTFARTVAGMRLLADAGVAFGVMTTLTAYNAAEFAQVAAVASDAGAGRASPFSVVLALVLAAAS